MNENLTAAIVTSAVTGTLTIAGWAVAYLIALKQYTATKRKEARVTYLLEAWRKLEASADRKEKRTNQESDAYNRSLETAIADIQLFGTKEQISLADEFIDAMIATGEADTIPLITLLRQDLRKELKLDPPSDGYRVFRLHRSNRLPVGDPLLSRNPATPSSQSKKSR